MKDTFAGTGRGPRVSSVFIEAICETLVAVTIAAAVCISVVSLSTHLNEARAVRASTAESAAVAMPADAAVAASHLN